MFDKAFVKRDIMRTGPMKASKSLQNRTRVQTSPRQAFNSSEIFSSYYSALHSKPRGFIDFDLQLARPELNRSNAHEKRFDNMTLFPRAHSNTKECPKVEFAKYLPRTDVQYRLNMSDSLFDREKHLNVYKPKP